MDAGLAIAVFLALGFAVTNGLHDASNAIATLVATRAARPSQAIVMATFFNLLGPLAARCGRRRHDWRDRDGLAVGGDRGDRLGPCGGHRLEPHDLAPRIALEFRPCPGRRSRRCGRHRGRRSCRQLGRDGRAASRSVSLGRLIALAVSPVLGVLAALAVIRILRRAARRGTHRWRGGAQAGQWVTSAALSFSHGANDAQKTVGVVAALLLADGRIDSLSAPTWVIVACSVGAYGRHSARWLAHHSHRGPAHLSHPPSRGTLIPELIGGRNPRRLVPRCARLHKSGRRIVGGRNWCRTPDACDTSTGIWFVRSGWPG